MSTIIRKWMRPIHPAVEPPYIAVFRNHFSCGPGGGMLDLCGRETRTKGVRV